MEKNKNLNVGMIMIGGSAGSLPVLLYLFPNLHKNFSIPITIVLHRVATNDNILAQLLSEKSMLHVKEADEKETPQRGYVYIAPPDYHLLVEKDYSFSLDYSEKINYSRPSIDVTFQSAADAYGSSLLCVLLSGANADGAAGLKHVKEKGGIAIVQQPETAEVNYMPQQAIQMQKPHHIFSPAELLEFLNKL